MDERTKIAGTTGGAIGLGALASLLGLCCIGPWTVALFGVSGAVAMARFESLRPYLLVPAAIMIAWAFRRIYGSAPVCDAAGCGKGPSIWLKSMLWIAVLLTLAGFFADQLQSLLIDPTPGGLG